MIIASILAQLYLHKMCFAKQYYQSNIHLLTLIVLPAHKCNFICTETSKCKTIIDQLIFFSVMMLCSILSLNALPYSLGRKCVAQQAVCLLLSVVRRLLPVIVCPIKCLPLRQSYGTQKESERTSFWLAFFRYRNTTVSLDFDWVARY